MIITTDLPGVMPIATMTQIDHDVADGCLARWGHAMGPCRRPTKTWAHALWHHDEIVAVAVTATLIGEQVSGFSRAQAIELARLCAGRPHLCRVALRLWREFVFPSFGRPWAISYQDNHLHGGNTYRFDGWVRLGRSRSGTDTRTGRIGRDKTVWGWCSDPATRNERRAAA